MKRFYVVTMPDGSKWGVPAEVIARNKAKYYSSNIVRSAVYSAEYDAMIKWFDTQDYEFEDWARNNMDWDDVKEHAIRMPSETADIDWQEGWVNGECEYITAEVES